MSYKEAEFGKYPYDWSIGRLGKYITTLTDYHANGSYKKLKENVELIDEEDYAIMIRTTNFEKNDFDKKSFKYITNEAYDFLEKTKVYPNDILMNKIANAGSVYLMPSLEKPVSLAMNLFLIRFDEKIIDQKYAYYFMKNYEAYIKTRASGSVTKTITKENVRNLEIAFPNIQEQHNIVNILSTLEQKIEVNKQINKTLEEMAQIIFKHWFVDFEFPNENGEPYKSSGGEMIESELGMIPMGWEVNKIVDFTDIKKGLSYKGKHLVDSGTPLINLGNILPSGGFREDKIKYYDGEYKEHHTVKYGDIVIANTDMTQDRVILGSPCFVPKIGTSDIIYTHHLFAFKNITISKNYFYFYLKSSSFRERAESYAIGTTVLALPKNAVMDMRFVYPNENIIKLFDNLLTPILDNIETLNEEIQKLKNIRDTLLPKLMSGEIRVPIDYEEVS